MLCEAHRQRLSSHYAIDPERPEIKTLEELGKLRTVTSQEIENLSGWKVDGSGLYIGYPTNESFVIRPDNTLPKGPKYLHPRGEPNSLFIPPGFDLAKAQDLWITEGELKALAGSLQGLPIMALGGVYSWRTTTEEASLLAEGERLRDEEALLPELAEASWEGKRIALLYDSDITPGHKAYPAYERLAEQLYRLGAGEVKIISLPPLPEVKGKVGLDDFIRLKGPEEALQALQDMRDRKDSYLPTKAGGLVFAERLIKSSDPKDKLKAAIAILGATGGEYSAGAWLNEHSLLKRECSLLIKEAKVKLKTLQAKPRASSQASGSQDLGEKYAEANILLAAIKEYCLDESGYFYKVEKKFDKETGEEEIKLKPLSNFVAWPTKEIIKDNGLTTERFTEIKGILQGGASLKPVEISGKALQEMKWLIEKWGVRPAIKPYQEQEVRYALQLLAQSGIPETNIYCHLGWRKIEDKWVFLHAGGAVGSEAVEVEINERLQRYKLPNKRIEYVLGLLNSNLLVLLYRGIAPPKSGNYFEVKTAIIRRLPFRHINFSDQADISRHDHMVFMVEQMLTLQKQLQEAQTPHEKTTIQRQIEATDRQIDALVYELYGLTEEEIKIVEGM